RLRSLHTGEVVGSIPTAPTIFPRLFCDIGDDGARRNAAKTDDSATGRTAGCERRGKKRSDVWGPELPQPAHCHPAGFERAHLHESVRYSFHHVQLVGARNGG